MGDFLKNTPDGCAAVLATTAGESTAKSTAFDAATDSNVWAPVRGCARNAGGWGTRDKAPLVTAGRHRASASI